MVLMRPGCYLQSMNNDPASMLAAHWLPSLVFLAGFLLTFPCPITSSPSPINISPGKLCSPCHSQLRLGSGDQQGCFLPEGLSCGRGRGASKKGSSID